MAHTVMDELALPWRRRPAQSVGRNSAAYCADWRSKSAEYAFAIPPYALAGLRRIFLGMEPHRGAVQRFIQRHINR